MRDPTTWSELRLILIIRRKPRSNTPMSAMTRSWVHQSERRDHDDCSECVPEFVLNTTYYKEGKNWDLLLNRYYDVL